MSGFKAYVLTIEFLQQMRENSLLVTVGVSLSCLFSVWYSSSISLQCRLLTTSSASTFPATFGSAGLYERARLRLSKRADEITRVVHCFCLTTSRRASRREVKGLTGEVSRGAEVCLLRTESEGNSCPQVSSEILFPSFRAAKQPLAVVACSKFVPRLYFVSPYVRAKAKLEARARKLRAFRLCSSARAGEKCKKRCGLEKTVVTIYDIQNKFVAYSALIPGVVDVFFEWGSLFVLVQDGKASALEIYSKKDTQSKLEVLFKKNQYSLAISLAKSQQYDEDGLIDIFRQYGDHLYSKGDHEGAVQMYIKTIGKLEASYVIRKFLDAQRINNLTEYLQELHRKGAASEDHTTLLLNCYIRLDENDKLTQFIMTEGRAIDFDVETAIRVCRQAGYFSQALYLAEKHGCDDLYLHIQLENCRDYLKALHYISRLPFREAEDYMKKYGKVLLNEIPEETTHLLKRLCTDYRPSNEQKSHPEDFIHIFVNKSDKLLEFLEHMVKVQPNSSSLVYNTLLELHLQVHNHEPDSAEKKLREQKIMDMLRSWESMYDLDQAMVLCQMNNFRRGILHLYEKAKLYQQILSYHIENSEYDSVIKICERFGTNDPNLWIQALWFFAQAGESQKTYFKTIEKGKLLPPIMVVEIASRSQTATLSLIKDYLIRHLQSENRQTEENERLMNQYKEDTAKARSEIEDLRHNPKIFQVSKCCGCNHQLELPSVHFLCGHSYHQHCFENYAESDTECPECLAKNSKTLDILRSQEQTKDLHEQFHHLLERSEDGFSVVAEYLGKGLFNKVTLLTDGAGAPHSKPGPRNARPPTGSGLPLHVQRDVLLQ
ncbi:unnamed protein product [Ixodes persulcatus]